MAESSQKEIFIECTCRILMTLGILVIVAGYISFIQTQYQLDSPLIPESAVYDIIKDSGIMKVSLIAGAVFLTGLWFYFFNKKIIAIIFFGLIILFYYLPLNFS